jgi:hypothetical protein
VEGAILGWPCYDEHGPVGLNPDESATYCLDPAGRRPPVWFSLPVDDVYVADGFADEDLAYFQLRPVPNRAAATNSVFLNAASGPAAVWVDGKAIKPVAAGANRWEIAVNRDSFLAAIFREPPVGFASFATHRILCRDVDPVTRRDILRPSFLAATVSQIKADVKIEPAQQKATQIKGESQVHIPLKAAAGGVLRISSVEAPPPTCRWDGKAVAFRPSTSAKGQTAYSLEAPMRAGEAALLSLTPTVTGTFTFQWLSAAGAANSKAVDDRR